MRKTTYLWLIFFCSLYFFILIFNEQNHPIKNINLYLSKTIPILLVLTFLSWTIRYYRWFYLLKKTDTVVSFKNGFFPYLAGFAFTATPGKLGELVRVRYFSILGCKKKDVVSLFVIERACDLLAVLGLASIALTNTHLFMPAIGFVVMTIMFLFIICTCAKKIKLIPFHLHKKQYKKTAKTLMTIINGITQSRKILKIKDFLFSLFVGLIAWGVLSYAFVILLNSFNLYIPLNRALSIYPLSMLAGAASMLPGGIGTTESGIVYLLHRESVNPSLAIVCAITIRIITLWMAILFGILATFSCELKIKFSNTI